MPAVRPRAVRERSVPSRSADTAVYIESSALLAAFLEDDAAVRRALRASRHRITSALTLAEAHRAVVRARALNRLTADEERAIVRGLSTFATECEIVAVTDDVLTRAGRPFPVEPVRTLDAIHLASVLFLRQSFPDLVIASADERVSANAALLGFQPVAQQP